MALAYTILVASLGSRIEEFLVPILIDQGYAVETSIGPTATLESVGPQIDLLLVDLPSEHELPAFHDLREQTSTSIIVLGPPRNDPLLVAALELGADDYVQRPFRTDELMARVRAQLRRLQWDRFS
ncbi:response regulator-like protein [Oscillochloris trichoides DG-6]|uniref:Response regulator-like protein n=1 Tax=Oscillochloris trichoides DG-6 TaxID=765420 RepID=E1IGW8_9CHLR|nr:response regulator [Oscillochloris trichoides]EFO79443.1 response regulator-like protein [Oscillochloris trichoides DG-6]